MTAPDAFVLPIEQILDKGLWPRDEFGPPGYFSPAGPGLEDHLQDWLNELFEQVYYSDYRVVEGDGSFGFQVNLWIKGPLSLSINSFYGFDFEVGGAADDDWVKIPATIRLGDEDAGGVGFEILFHRLKVAVRLPRDIFQKPSSKADPFEPEPYRFEVPITGQLRIDEVFDLHFTPAAPISFGPVELFQSGFTATVQNAVLDLSREQKVQAVVDADLPDDFRGFFAQKVFVELPPYLSGLENYEIFMENLGIGTGGLHGTIGLRQRMAETIPEQDRPTVTAKDNVAFIYTGASITETVFPEQAGIVGELSPGELAYVIGKSADERFYLIDTTQARDEELRGTGLGFGWVMAPEVHTWGNFSLVPVVPARTSDPFTENFPSITWGSVSLRLEQFFITFRDSVPLPGIVGGIKLPLGGDESLEVTLTIDSQMVFGARLTETLPRTPAPDTSRVDTFAIAPQDIAILRVNAIDLGAKKLRRSDSVQNEDEWFFHVLADLTIYFRWSFKKRNVEDGELVAATLNGLGVSGTLDDFGPALPTVEKLKLSAGKDEKDIYTEGLKIGALAFSVNEVGAGVDSGGAFYLQVVGSLALSAGLKAKGTLGIRFRWGGGEYLGPSFERARLRLETTALTGDLLVQWVDEVVPDGSGFKQLQGWRGRGQFELCAPPRVFANLEAAFGDEPTRHLYFFVEIGSESAVFALGPIGFFGISGLYGYNFVPDKGADQRWYEDWFRDKSPKFSAVAVEKWRVEPDAGHTFGLGTIIGSPGNQGYTYSSKVIFVYTNPGPVFLLAGHGNIMTSMAELEHPERSQLSVLIVYDREANTFAFTAGAKYEKAKTGSEEAKKYGAGTLYEAGGLVDLFFDLSRSSRWHVYMGERSKEKRIRSNFLKVFRADGYLMIDPTMIELGVSIGWSWEKKLGPLRVELAAWVEGVLGYIFEPDQLFGALRIGGSARLSAFGIGLGITVGADLAGGTCHPYFYLAEFVFRLDTPWFLPDIEKKYTTGERRDELPPPPLPMRSVALTNDQPVPGHSLRLYPDLDPDGDRLYMPDGFDPDAQNPTIPPVTTTYDEDQAIAEAPLTPLDAKPIIGFGHPFNDCTGLVTNPTGEFYTETYGQEGFFRYDLTMVQLFKRPRGSTGAWTLLDERLPGENRDPIDWSDHNGDLHIFGHTQLYGSLMLDRSSDGSLPVGLKLWAKTPFNIHMATDQEVDEALGGDSDYPCPQPPDEPAEHCADYAQFSPGQPLAASHLLGEVWVRSPSGGRVVRQGPDIVGLYTVDVVAARIRIDLPERVSEVRIRLGRARELHWSVGREGVIVSQGEGLTDLIAAGHLRGVDWVEFYDPALVEIVAGAVSAEQQPGYRLLEVCYIAWKDQRAFDRMLAASDQVQKAYPDGVDLQAETVLEPYQEYKLMLQTRVLFSESGLDDEEEWSALAEFPQHTYFKTAGPPGLFPTDSPLRDLLPYVHHSTPEDGTIPYYRGYDVRVAFRDDAAIQGMYARSLESLQLLVTDGTEGILIGLDTLPELLATGWIRDGRIAANYQMGLWRDVLDRSPCISPADHSGGDVLVGSPLELLKPERAYDGAVVLKSSPYFRRSRFVESDLATMSQVDFGPGVPGNWLVEDGNLLHRSRPPIGNLGVPLGETNSARVLGEPEWRNYRITATVSATSGEIGLIAGYHDADHFYLATLNSTADRVKILKKETGSLSQLAELTPANPLAQESHTLGLVFTGEWLQVILDDEQLDPVFDATYQRGMAGLYASKGGTARFNELLVEGNPLYSFSFTTSRYAHFKEQIASFTGSSAHLPAPVNLTDISGQLVSAFAAFPPNADNSEQAGRQRDEVVNQVFTLLGIPLADPQGHLEVTLIEGDDGPIAWLIESPEPLHWRDRTSLAIARQQIDDGDFWLDPDSLRLHPELFNLDREAFDRNASLVERSPRLANLPANTRRAFRRLQPAVAGRSPGPNTTPERVLRRSLLEHLTRRNDPYLRLARIGETATGSLFIELAARNRLDLSGSALQLRSSPDGGEPSYVELFRFPPKVRVEAGDTIQISEEALPEEATNTANVLVFTMKQRLPREQGSLLRLVGRNGFILGMFPYFPVNKWEDIDPSQVRLIFTPDTRKAVVFLTSAAGVPQHLQGGQYRFGFTFRRDLGTPESTWSYRGDVVPETASLSVRVPGEAGPPAPGARTRHLRLILEEIAVHEDLDAWWQGAGELAVRVTITPKDSGGAPIVVDLPAGEAGHYRVREGTNLKLNVELFDGLIGEAGAAVRIDGLELDPLDASDVLPTLDFKAVAAAESESPRRPELPFPPLRRPPTEASLEQRRGPWSARIRFRVQPAGQG